MVAKEVDLDVPKWVDKLMRSDNQEDRDVQLKEANNCEENSDDGHYSMEDTSLCKGSGITTDREDILPDPWQTKIPYGL